MPTMGILDLALGYLLWKHRQFLGVIDVINATDVTYFRHQFQNKTNYNLAVPIFAHAVYQEKTQLPQAQISNIRPTQNLHHVVRLYIFQVSQSAELIPGKQTTKGPLCSPYLSLTNDANLFMCLCQCATETGWGLKPWHATLVSGVMQCANLILKIMSFSVQLLIIHIIMMHQVLKLFF